MDIDPKNYPSRTFVRFTARNQLMADASGQPITMSVNRFGGNTYLQQAIPGEEFLSTDSGSFSGSSPGADNEALTYGIDEVLFAEIVKTTFNPSSYPELYQSCGTRKAAADIEARVADEIVTAYRSIKQKQNCPIVQSWNSRL